MLILIILLPLLGFFSGSLFGRFLGVGVCFLTTLSVFTSFILSLLLFPSALSSRFPGAVDSAPSLLSEYLDGIHHRP